MSTIDERKTLAAQRYALDNCQDDMSQLGSIQNAFETGFDTALSREILINGQSLDDWEKWIVNELTPPMSPIMTDEVIYTMESFLELIKTIKNN